MMGLETLGWVIREKPRKHLSRGLITRDSPLSEDQANLPAKGYIHLV